MTCGYAKCSLCPTPPETKGVTLMKYLNKLILFSQKKNSAISDIVGWPGTYWIKMTFQLDTNPSPIREYIKNKFASFNFYDLVRTELYKSLPGLIIFKTLCKTSKNKKLLYQYVRTLEYVISKIKNRCKTFPGVKYDHELDFL